MPVGGEETLVHIPGKVSIIGNCLKHLTQLTHIHKLCEVCVLCGVCSCSQMEKNRLLDDTGGGRIMGEMMGWDDRGKLEAFLRLVLQPGTAVELRAIGSRSAGRWICRFPAEQVSDITEFALAHSGLARGVYFTLNPLHPPVLSSGNSATKKDVLRRRLLLIDADPERPGQVSSTDSEKGGSRQLIQRVRDYLREKGWPEPILCDSGNGYHLLYRVDLPTEDGGLIQRVLHALGDTFDTDSVKIDRKVFDPTRLCKLPYTLVCKGPNTPERPHPPSCVLDMPSELLPVTVEQLEAIAGPLSSEQHKEGEIKAKNGLPDIQSNGRPVVPPKHVDWVSRRARAYLEKVPPAVEGQGGDRATFAVACILENDFALPFSVAWPLLLEWNKKCKPPWEEKDLLYKWEQAVKTSKGPRGAKIEYDYIRRALIPPCSNPH